MGSIKGFKNRYKNMPVRVRASLWFVVCGFLQRGISTLTTPIFTRLLTTEEYGLYSTFTSWLDIITIFATLRLGFGVYMQGLVKFEDDKNNFSSSLLSLATTWWGVSFTIYLLFSNFWNKIFGLSTLEMVCMFIMMISTVAFNFWSVKKRVEVDYVPLVKLTLLVSLLKPTLGITAVYLFPDNRVTARIVSLAVVELVCYVGLYFSIIRKGRHFDKKYWRHALKFNIPLIPHFLSQTILNQSDRIMIRSLVGPGAAGIYSLAYNISIIMSIINTSIQNTLSPWVYKKIKDKEHDRIGKVSYMVLSIVALANFVLIAVAPEVLFVFAPSSYHGAVYVIPPVAMGNFFIFMYSLFANFETYLGKTVYMMTASVTGAVLNLVLNYIFIPKFGYMAAAYTTLLCYIVYTVLHYYFMRMACRKLLDNIKVYDMRIILAITAAFMISGQLMVGLYDKMILRYAIILAIAAVMIWKRKYITNILKPILKKG